jgi:beta-phosphoglucomutase
MSHRPQVERVLSVLGLKGNLNVVATMDDVKRGKPDPEIDLLVAKKLGVPSEEFLVIEDSRAGVEAAVAAGMVVVAAPTRMTSKGVRVSNLLEPRWVVENPETLADVVRQRIEEAGGRREGAR